MDSEDSRETLRSIERNMASSALFGTTDGRIGKGPRSVIKGDEVWILAGAKVPYILRPIGSGRYEFIGEAYIRGIMFGEAVWSSKMNSKESCSFGTDGGFGVRSRKPNENCGRS